MSEWLREFMEQPLALHILLAAEVATLAILLPFLIWLFTL
jgi:hypothetical protein